MSTIPSQIEQRKILYAALDWGLGHVTRSIGIIRELQAKNEVVVACNKTQQALFATYFPQLVFLPLEGYRLRFSGKGNWGWDLLLQSRKFLKAIQSESEFVHKMVEKHNFDLIISDHRYGFCHSKIESVFITHQLHLPLSKTFFPIQNWHEKRLRKFKQIWVPDEQNNKLAGKLSHPIIHPDIRYIGYQSRFTLPEIRDVKYDFLIVISGPKPYADQMMGEILLKLDFEHKKVAVLSPPDVFLPVLPIHFEVFLLSNLKTDDGLFAQSETIVSRAGYSTLMDLKCLDKNGILIPTPGQAEQLYLAKHLAQNKQFRFI